MASSSRRLEVDDPLIPTSRPGAGMVGKRIDVRTVHQHIDAIENGVDARLLPRSHPECLVDVPAVAQDVRAAARTERLHQRKETSRLREGLATQDGDPIAVKSRIEQSVRKPANRDEGAGIGGMEVRDPTSLTTERTKLNEHRAPLSWSLRQRTVVVTRNSDAGTPCDLVGTCRGRREDGQRTRAAKLPGTGKEIAGQRRRLLRD